MKKNMILKTVILLLLTSISSFLLAQAPPSKFGRISIEAFENDTCPIDSSAHAYFIFDYGKSYFKYGDTKIRSDEPSSANKGFQLYFTRHYRIKIIDNRGFSWADVEIPLYENIKKEKIVRIRARTYNLKDNKIIKTKLSGKNILSEQTSKNFTTRKFAMPNVQKGSIIEIEYTIKSDFYFNLRPWDFQKSIPVLESEYHVSIPEYFSFNQRQSGYFPIETNQDSQPKEVTIEYYQKAEGISVREGTYTNTHNYRDNNYHYHAKEIPAFPEEKYLRTKDNYLTKIEFELQQVQFPNARLVSYTKSWRDINDNLLDNSNFGKELKKSAHITKDAKILKKLDRTNVGLLTNAFYFIKDKMVWNGNKNKYITSSLSKAYKNNEGNCADINLNLVLLLRELDFEAYPVILSTQDYGIVYPSHHPSISKFNYVVAMAIIDDQIVLMDATDPYSEMNLLPIRCLNGQGRVVNEAGGSWVDLLSQRYSSIENYKLDMDKDFNFNGTHQSVLKGYASYLTKKEILTYNNITEYKSSIEEKYEGCKIDEIDVVGLDTVRKSLKIATKFDQNNYVEHSENIGYFQPVLRSFIEKNPFQLDQREYPVEFDYPHSIKQLYTITLPKNISITEIPKKLLAHSSDGTMKYLYEIKQHGDKIILLVTFSSRKTVFLPEEYEMLKDFYQMIIDKQGELIVFDVKK